MNTLKLLQRQTYDILSSKYYLLFFILLINTSLISVLHFCEVWIGSWPRNLHQSMKMFTDNIGGIDFQNKLCQYSPIDVVYTWVNGSDPILVEQLKLYRTFLKMDASRSCRFESCVPSHLTAVRSVMSQNINLNSKTYISYEIINVGLDQEWIVIAWDSINTATHESDETITNDESNASYSHVHWTTDKTAVNVYSPNNTIALSCVVKDIGFLTKQQLEGWIGRVVHSLWVYSHVAYAQLISEHHVSALLEGKPWRLLAVDHKVVLNITRGYYILELPSQLNTLDFAPSRFEDKEELRYSLRSLEKFAPWVRKVYIVTNGQIPHWLDLSNPRITIIPHNIIFTNKSDLPTFSSPAIEAHVHRIPGLSEKFLYINDDIFFGEEVWPEDFITKDGSQKVYLSWPVPDCTPLCPWSWVGDKTCDVPCNVSACDFDGGDCNSTKSGTQHTHFHEQDDKEEEEYVINKNEKQKESKVLEDYDNIANIRPYKNEENSVLFRSNEKSRYIFDDNVKLEKLLSTLSKEGGVLSPDTVKILFKEFSKTLTNKVNRTLSESDVLIKELVQAKNVRLFKNSVLLNKLIHKYINCTQCFNNTKSNSLNKNLWQVRKLKNADGNVPARVPHILTDSARNNVQDATFTRNISSSSNRINLTANTVTPEQVPAVLGLAERFYAVQPERSTPNRKLDTFAQSLLHVNSLLNKRYSFKARKVPAHMPHLIDRNIVSDLQDAFPKEYAVTSSHRFRNPQDMQFAFAYFYFLMSEEIHLPVSEIFNIYDTDGSGTWSDREIRTVLTRLYDLPLQRSSVVSFETNLLYCAKNYQHTFTNVVTPQLERYLGSKLPTVTQLLIEECEFISGLLTKKLAKQKRYDFTLVKPADRQSLVGFHMITSNLSHVLLTLDKIRSKPKKFICLNDNMNAAKEKDNELIRSVLLDFYHSLLPIPSQFELPSEFRNRFLYYKDFLTWQAQRIAISTAICSVILLLAVGLIVYLFRIEFQRLCITFWRCTWKLFTTVISTFKPGRKQFIHKA